MTMTLEVNNMGVGFERADYENKRPLIRSQHSHFACAALQSALSSHSSQQPVFDDRPRPQDTEGITHQTRTGRGCGRLVMCSGIVSRRGTHEATSPGRWFETTVCVQSG